MKLVLILMLVSTLEIPTSADVNDELKNFKHTNIILIGATGDLAQKYLWMSLFELFGRHYEHNKHAFSIYGCSRVTPDAGRQFISDIILKVIMCPKDDSDCKSKKKKFVEAIQYHQLKTEKHYEALASKINENIQSMYGLQGGPLSPEDGRLIYMSIPPSAYAKTGMMVDKYLRPVVGRPWLRVVIEKPFGHSFESARELIDKLGQYFTEKEIYRTDHYLGKTIVREVLPFRYKNKDIYEPLWNRHHIERVEVVMKEKLNAQGRVGFYEEVGVVRDVMQNHLTELATLVGMDLPENSGVIRDILNSKVKFLQQVEPLSDQALLLGQYKTYTEECQEELKHAPATTNTPTYGAAVLSVNTPRWQGVPFVLMSGKKLDEKFSYIRIVFKDNKYSMQHTRNGRYTPKQIVFHISSGNMLFPDMITVSKNVPIPVVRNEWRLEEETSDRFFFGESMNDTYQLLPQDAPEAYTVLLDSAYQGHRHMFIDSRSLLSSWKIWNNVLKNLPKQNPRIYQGGKTDMDRLDFDIHSTRALEFVQKEKIIVIPDLDGDDSGLPEVKQIPGSFRDTRLVTGKVDDVISKLADKLESSASDAIRDRGIFHLALPGGQSPVLLFQHLATWRPQFPWLQTHIWQVDERCVFQDEPQSNFHQIHTHLLQYVPIPYLNIHPMPVDLTCEPCSLSDIGNELYESKINRLIINSTMDFTLLGVGYDGHIASLFPNQTSLDVVDDLVVYSEAGGERVSPRRMSLTYPILSRSRYIAVLVLGTKKHGLLENIEKLGADSMKEYPVLGLKSSEHSQLVWYIDEEAYFGAS